MNTRHPGPYTVTAPSVPGAGPVVQATVDTLEQAREEAKRFAHRRDLSWQDVVIWRGDKRVTFAGPER